ncbi:ABC transporter permease [Streptomyces triticirhizae]|uniref:ABC transporter permease n=1 Tax=Streptomyces triticirhizae TaxID=2483353 RepID=A0A3M2M8V0_9ACTN|nr:ABC transporter permease [Streptomyces triticirhizae]RMI43568.1 ABC transporter permease [Streptomyces triticirhizae]
MDSPQPAPEHRSLAAPHAGQHAGQHDPWAAPRPRPAADGGREWRREIRDGALVAVPVALLTGVALGLLWVWRAPRVPLVLRGEDVLLANSEGQQAIAADGVFLLLGLGVGAVTGLVTFLVRRAGGVGVVVGLALGAGLGAWLAWQLGMMLGPTDDVVGRIAELEQNEVFDAPLELSAKSVLLGLPFGALLIHLLCVAGFGPRDERARPADRPPHWGAPPRA